MLGAFGAAGDGSAIFVLEAFDLDEQLEFLMLIVSRLESAGIEYMLTGSMAMAVYSVPRMTRDIDIVVACRTADADRLVALFEGDCCIDAETVRNAVEERATFNVIHNDWIIKADFIVRKDEPYRRAEFERRRRMSIGEAGGRVHVVAPEDLILSKLVWAKDSMSELQLRDSRQIVDSVPDLDWAYLERWARELGITGLLDRVRE